MLPRNHARTPAPPDSPPDPLPPNHAGQASAESRRTRSRGITREITLRVTAPHRSRGMTRDTTLRGITRETRLPRNHARDQLPRKHARDKASAKSRATLLPRNHGDPNATRLRQLLGLCNVQDTCGPERPHPREASRPATKGSPTPTPPRPLGRRGSSPRCAVPIADAPPAPGRRPPKDTAATRARRYNPPQSRHRDAEPSTYFEPAIARVTAIAHALSSGAMSKISRYQSEP
jgi:hypothetical protein